MFEYNGMYYTLNLKKINEYIFKSQTDKNVETEITENYEANDDIKQNLINKTIREVKANGNTNLDAMKYDLFKELLSVIVNIEIDEEGEMELSFGEKMALNTFLKEGFLEQINPNNTNF